MASNIGTQKQHNAEVLPVVQPPKYQAVCRSCVWKGRVWGIKERAMTDLWDHVHGHRER